MKKTIILAALFAASSASFAATTTLWKTTYSNVLNQGADPISNVVVNNTNGIGYEDVFIVTNPSKKITLGQTAVGGEGVSYTYDEGNTDPFSVKNTTNIIAGTAGVVGQGAETSISYNYGIAFSDLAPNHAMSITAIKIEWVVFDDEGQFLGTSGSPSHNFNVQFQVQLKGQALTTDLSRNATIAGQGAPNNVPVTLINGQAEPMMATFTKPYLQAQAGNFDFEVSAQGLPQDEQYANLYVGLKSVEFLGEIVEVPEPATASLGILGLGALMLRRRRR